jgi:tRNA-splicing ligase RtcB (3'-phosphate/5'-hydroxy nucleic acid ligase)
MPAPRKCCGKKIVLAPVNDSHHQALPERYRETGQPVFIPGSMGTASYVLSGTETAMQESFGSTCHGAGRQLSRRKAKQTVEYNRLRRELHEAGIEARAGSAKGWKPTRPSTKWST